MSVYGTLFLLLSLGISIKIRTFCKCCSYNICQSYVELAIKNVKLNNRTKKVPPVLEVLTRKFVFLLMSIKNIAFPSVTIYSEGSPFSCVWKNPNVQSPDIYLFPSSHNSWMACYQKRWDVQPSFNKIINFLRFQK